MFLAKVSFHFIPWGKVMLYQLSYFRIRLFYSYRSLTTFCWMFLAKVSFHFIPWGKVMLYQLSYFRIRLFYSYRSLTTFCWMFLAKVSFHFISLGQGYALPTELLPHSFIHCDFGLQR
jgi:hypothetical protein